MICTEQKPDPTVACLQSGTNVAYRAERHWRVRSYSSQDDRFADAFRWQLENSELVWSSFSF